MSESIKAEDEGIAYDLQKIGYLSDPVENYSKDLTRARSLTDLRAIAKKWESVASDAFAVIEMMSQEDFEIFAAGLRKERRGHFAGEEFARKYGHIMMPDVLFVVGTKAIEFQAPWGLVYIRMRDAGLIEEKNGVAALVTKS